VVNGVLPHNDVSTDPLAAARYEREQAALSAMPAVLKDLPAELIELKGFNLVGVAALRGLFDDATDVGSTIADAVTVGSSSPIDLAGLGALVDEIAAAGRGLVMMGKGGVGKTTMAQRSQWRWRHGGYRYT
jgi:arsenite-transporting ATPase